LDGSLLRIDRVAMTSKRDRAYYSGKDKAHGVNMQVIADPVGRPIWTSPPLPGARHDTGAEHGIGRALADANITAYADTAYHGTGPTEQVPHRRVRYDKTTRKFARRSLSTGQKAVNRALRTTHPANEPTPT
jgi:hypothetical protein